VLVERHGGRDTFSESNTVFRPLISEIGTDSVDKETHIDGHLYPGKGDATGKSGQLLRLYHQEWRIHREKASYQTRMRRKEKWQRNEKVFEWRESPV